MISRIPFNKPFIIGKELQYIKEAVETGKISGDGEFTMRCNKLLEQRYSFNKCLLTTSCTDALEMTAILADIEPGDEVIAPSYTFVSTVNAFVLRGAKIVFADSMHDSPNIDHLRIESLITKKTKVIIVVHYAGIACEMNSIAALAKKHNLILIEDAAQAINAFYNGKPLGTLGDMSAFSFHETKNIISGEGGMIVINNPNYNIRAEVIREKGTDRSAFFRGEIDKYEWIDIGSSFLPSEIISAFLYAQLECLDKIQEKRQVLWKAYQSSLQSLADEGIIDLPFIPPYATHNAHIFYLTTRSAKERSELIQFLNANNIHATSHYIVLHKSSFYNKKYSGPELPNADRFMDTLVRLPIFYDLTLSDIEYISLKVKKFFK